MKRKFLWLCCEADEYELPIAVADTARELGEMVGSNKHNVELNALRGYNGRCTGMKFVKIIDDEKE